MNRFLLALLALLGLAAQTAPVQARVCGAGNAAVGSCLTGSVIANRGEVRAEVGAVSTGSDKFDPARMAKPVEQPQIRIVPTVYIGSDRARE